MAITRITTWADGNVLTAAALNGEFDNIINNANGLISPLTTSLDFNLNQAINLKLELLSATPSTVTTGRLYHLDTFRQQLFYGVSSTAFTGYEPVRGNQLGRVVGLRGSLISNIGSFEAGGGYRLSSRQLGTVSISATSSFSINTQTPGPTPGGRDQAAAFGSPEVHFYAFSDRVGSTVVRGICSTAPPPNGPTGVSFWTYLCSVPYSTASSAVEQPTANGWWVRGSKVWSKDNTAGTNVAADNVLSTVYFANIVPPTATEFLVGIDNFRGMAASTGSNVSVVLRLRAETGSGSSPDIHTLTVSQTSPGAGLYSGGLSYSAGLPNLGTTGGKFEYSSIVSAGTSANFDYRVLNYTVPNGDN